MKTTKILAFIFLLSFNILLSCDKSEEPGASIVGTWKLTQSESYDCDVAADNGVKTCGTFAWCVTTNFKADKSFEIFRTSDNVKLSSGTYVFANGMLVTSPTGTTGSSYPVTLSGSTMVINIVSATASCSSNNTYQKI